MTDKALNLRVQRQRCCRLAPTPNGVPSLGFTQVTWRFPGANPVIGIALDDDYIKELVAQNLQLLDLQRQMAKSGRAGRRLRQRAAGMNLPPLRLARHAPGP